MNVSAIAICLVALLATTWLTTWLALSHFGAVRSVAIDRSLAFIHGLVAVLPLAWFGLTAALVARACLRLGEWPHGFEVHPGRNAWLECREANLDPAAFPLHHQLATTIGVAVLCSILVFPPLHVVVRGLNATRVRPWLAAYLLGVATFVALMCCEVGGVAEWLDG